MRYVGNTVFPNGFLEFDLQGEGNKIELQGAGKICLCVNGVTTVVDMKENQKQIVEVALHPCGTYHCRLTKSGNEYPWIAGVSLLK